MTISPTGWESFIIHLDILNHHGAGLTSTLRIFHYSPWYTYFPGTPCLHPVENLSLFTLIYLDRYQRARDYGWESFIIHLDILIPSRPSRSIALRIFHYSPWYTYATRREACTWVENLSLFTLMYLPDFDTTAPGGWESFIIHLDILRGSCAPTHPRVENLSLFTLIYLRRLRKDWRMSWESFIIHLDILIVLFQAFVHLLRIFHYSPWYTYDLRS